MSFLFRRILLFLKSLRLRIFAVILLAGFVPIFIVVFSFVSSYETRQVNDSIINMTGQAQLLNTQIVANGYLSEEGNRNLDVQINALESIYTGRIMIANESLRIVKDSYGIYEDRIFVWDDIVRGVGGETVTNFDRENHLITVVIPIVANQGKDEPVILGATALVRGTEVIEQGMVFFQRMGVIFLMATTIVLIILSYLVSTHITRPLKDMKKQIERLETHPGSISVKGYTEIEELTSRLDHFTNQLQTLDESRKQFVSNVSHELKTPLTSMKILADSLVGSDAPVEFYREFMHDITSEIDRETAIINDLLSIVRMEKDGNRLDVSAVNINDMLEQIMKQLKPIAQEREIDLVLETFRPITVEIDEVKMSQALLNLIENAIKYNQDSGWVHVSLNADHEYCYIRVEDNGIGIPEESIGKIFERFYRADESHSREIEGTGLGLSITRNIVLMHHGEIKVSSVVDEGTTFDLRIPLTYIAEEYV